MAEAIRANQNTPAAPAGAPADLDASVSALMDELSPAEAELGTLELTQGPDAGSASLNLAPPAPPESDDDLLRSVQELLSQVPDGQTAQPQPAPTKAAPSGPESSPAALETLDRELAGIADELISTEIGPEPEPADDPTLAGAVAAAAAPTRSPEPTPAPAASAPELPTALPEPRPAAAAPAPAPPKPPARTISAFAFLTRPILHACNATSAPLRNRPQHIRDIVGWNALWLGFLGACVWGYILFIRSPEAPVPTILPTTAHANPAGPAKAPAKKDAHAKPAAKKTAPKSGGH